MQCAFCKKKISNLCIKKVMSVSITVIQTVGTFDCKTLSSVFPKGSSMSCAFLVLFRPSACIKKSIDLRHDISYNKHS